MFNFRTALLATRFLAALVVLISTNAPTQAAPWQSVSAPRSARHSASSFGARNVNRRNSGRVLRDREASVEVRSFAKRAEGTDLKFTVSGFDSPRQSQLAGFVQAIYPQLVQVYGEPAPSQRGKTVAIVFDNNAGDGTYDLRNGVPGTIGYKPYPASELYQSYADAQGNCDATCRTKADTGALQRDQYNLSRQMLLAFHGLQGFQAEAWEYGFADAAALVANWKYYKTPLFNPAILGDYYLPGYDFFNRPGIGNRYFFAEKAPSGTDGFLAKTRIAVAQAAWLKVWVENPDFFSSFNSIYYARYNDNLRKDDGMLNSVAASIVPSVEGLTWDIWRAQQQILNTSIVSGDKLVLISIPLTDLDAGDTRSSFALFAFRFRTGSKGDDAALPGADVGQISVLDESGRDVTSLSNELREGQRVSFDGEGAAYFRMPNKPNVYDLYIGFAGSANSANGNREQGRFTVTLSVGAQQASAIFAYGVAGTVSRPNGIYGATTNALDGRLTVNLGGATDKATLARGAFGSSIVYPSSERVVANLKLLPSDGGSEQLFRRNFAWSIDGPTPQGVGVILDDKAITPGPTPTPTPATSSVTGAWAVRGDNHWRLVSLPIEPSDSDAAKVFQVPSSELRLARHRAGVAPKPAIGTRFDFGIDATRNEVYPRLGQAVGPGRAYWLYLPQSRRITVAGTLLPTIAPASVALQSGWNSVGVPFPALFNIGALQIRSGTQTVSWNEAIAQRWLMPGVWTWKSDGGYQRIDTTPSAAVVPFEGYFVYAVPGRALELIFDPANRSGALEIKNGDVARDNWRVAMSIRTRSASENDFTFGVVPQTANRPFGAARPPASERSVLLWFQDSGDRTAESSGAGRESGGAQSFKAPISARGSWQFFVDGAKAGEKVLLNWGDTRVVPSDLTLILVDQETGTRSAMTASATGSGTNSYLFVMGNVARRFTIEASPRALAQPSD